uniref:Putative transcription initiation protein n=1 Tax=Trypanosoma congolense (strain IL3000) TaxID=1068625 RepID=G0UJI8_TRYCI|nr:putative transcription initiation protein [Trypanosoma congolense IL3000]
MAEDLGVSELANLLEDHELDDLIAAPDVFEEHGTPHEDRTEGRRIRGGNKNEKRRKKHPRYEAKRNADNGEEDEGSESALSDEAPRKRSKYIIEAAESSGSEPDDGFIVESDEDVGEDVYRGFAPVPAERKRHIFREGEEGMTNEELARAIEQRYRASKREDHTEAPLTSGLPKGKLSSLRYASHLLPQSTDPKVFVVKCRPRMTRLLVARIVNKCYAYRIGRNYEQRRVDLGIISVFCLDHVKEYIYIESHRKSFVENALNGLDGVFRSNISLVNPSELMQMLEHRPTGDKIRIGSFVRLRRNPYRLDLAQVVSIDTTARRVAVKVVPREDFVGKVYNKPELRMPQRLFVPSLALDVRERGGMHIWGDLTFDRDGYLRLSMSYNVIIAGPKMEKPTVEELATFFNNDRGRVRDAAARLDSGGQMVTELHLGDVVRVVSGQLRGTTGVIENIFMDTNTAALSCPVPGRKDPIKLRVELAACVKHFAEGAHVIIDKGEYAGESGTVVKASGEVVHVFSDRATAVRELVVCASDCRQSNLVGSFSHTCGSWKLFDLVMLSDSSSVACIVRLNRNNVCVLTDRMETRYASTSQLKAVLSGKRQTTDRFANIITRGCEVVIKNDNTSPYHLDGQTGRVEQVFNTTLFVRVRSVKENSGLVVFDAPSVLLIGGRTTTRHIQQPRQLPVLKHRTQDAVKADLSVPNPRVTSEDWVGNSEWYEAEEE